VSQPLSQTSLRIRAVLSSIRRRTAARWWYKVGFTVLSICLIGAAKFDSLSEARAAIRHYATGARFASAVTDPDTAVFFGPKQFVAATSNIEIHFVESFSVPPQTTGGPGWMPAPNQYTIRIQRVGGSLTTANVSINGTRVATAADFASATYIERPITVSQTDPNTNSLTVVLKGAVGAGLVVTVVGIPDATFSIFGPNVYAKGATTPTIFLDNFVPPSGASAPFTVSARASVAGTNATITLNGVEVIKATDWPTGVIYVVKTVSVLNGSNSVKVAVRGNTGTTITVTVSATDKTPPTLTITAPPPNFVTNANTVAVSGTSQDQQPTQVKVNGVVATMSGAQNTNYSATVPLTEGANSIAIRATDRAGNHTDSTRTVTRDTQAPTLTVTSPVDGSYTNQNTVTVAGTVTDATTVTVKVNGVTYPVGQGGAFSGSYTLAAGANFLTIAATDAGGNVTSQVRKVTQAKQPPVLTVTTPSDGFAKNTTPLTVSGTVTGTTPITVSANGVALTVTGSSFSGSVPLVQGDNDIAITATDPAGNTTVVHRTGKLDTQAPVLTLTAPADASYSNATTTTVSGTVTDESSFTVTVNGTAVAVAPNGSFTQTVTLAAGANPITVTATDAATNATTLQRTVTQDRTPPTLTVTAPADGGYSNATTVTVAGTASDATPLTVKVNGSPVTVNPDGSFSSSVTLVSGTNTISVIATDAATNATTVSRTLVQDRDPPTLSISTPNGVGVTTPYTNANILAVTVTVTDATPTTVLLNGAPLSPDGSGGYSGSVPLTEGVNDIPLVVTDAANNSDSRLIHVVSDTQAPVIDVVTPVEGAQLTTEPVVVSGTVHDATTADKTRLTINGVEVVPGSLVDQTTFNFSTEVRLATGTNAISVVATDGAGNSSTVTRTVTFGGVVEGVPPDPATIAPKLDASVATTTFASTSFLYTGTNPVQTGVAAGTIERLRAAELRGIVKTRSGAGLPGVRITVLGHPEFGQTLSRSDGAFDLVVNGGHLVTVNYEKTGFLPAQRQAVVQWQNYVRVDSVTLVSLDPNPTVVNFSQPAQSAQGSIVTDESGTRRATMIFKGGTHASLVLPDGSLRPSTSLTVRATEYTVGPSGPSAMPAELPASSAYTYAVELSADEATMAGASGIQFDTPVAVYVDNFLHFPTGGTVPVGYYDRLKAAWVSSRDGRVVTILAVSNGEAVLDVDGSGSAASPAALAALGIDQSELGTLATLYQPGTALWRIQVTHFSLYDLNWPLILPLTASPPNVDNPKSDSSNKDCPKVKGSIIGCERQTLGERLGIAGTPLSLVYQSDGVTGYKDDFTIDIPLGGESLPASALRIDLEVSVAGQVSHQSFPAVPNQVAHFVWDGKDVFGRSVGGVQHARVRIGYVYTPEYAKPSLDWGAFAFGVYEFGPISGDKARNEATLWQEMQVRIGSRGTPGWTIGGWTLDVHHSFDPEGRVLYLGDGTTRTGGEIPTVATTVASSDCPQFDDTGFCINHAQPGARATDVYMSAEGMAVASDGSMYIADDGTFKIWRVNTAGTLEWIAGNGTTEFNGDGIPATSTGILPAGQLRVGPDNSVYFVDYTGDGRIRRVDRNGIITTAAGSGICGDSVRTGIPASQADLCIYNFTLAKDGTLYVLDGTEVYRVGADGIISRIVGDGSYARCSPTVPSYSCAEGQGAHAHGVFNSINGMAIGVDGALYLANGEDRAFSSTIVYRIGADGIIRRFAGNGNRLVRFDDRGNGKPAIDGVIDSYFVEPAVGPDGTLYFVGQDGYLSHVDQTGVLRLLAGCVPFPAPVTCVRGGGERATLTRLGLVRALDFGPDGRLYILDDFARRIDTPMPTVGLGDFLAASEDGTELYVFNADGKHLRTLDALVGHTIYDFGYGATGLLSTITDVAGNAIEVERDDAGQPTAIVAPFGQRTELTLSGNYLSAFTPPGEPRVILTYSPDGLLKTLSDGNGSLHQFTYDGNGLLVRDEDPAGGFKSLVRSATDSSSAVTVTTALGGTIIHRAVHFSTGATERDAIDGAGLVSSELADINGTVTLTAPDGTITTTSTTADARLGMQTPVLNQTTIRTPGGLVSTMSAGRRVVLSDSTNPLSLVSQTDSSVVNGQVFRNQYVAATRTVNETTPVGRVNMRQFDEMGRVIEETTPNITPLQYQYDARGRVAQLIQGTRHWSYTYDPQGRVATTTDHMGQTSQFFYGAADRLSRQVLPDGRQVLYSYDAIGNLSSVTPSGRPAHTFQYNSVNLLTSYNPPGLGAGVWSTNFQYDLDGRLTQVERPDGQTIGFGYDAAGRPITVMLQGDSVEYSYNSSTGRLTQVTGPSGQNLSYGYDGSLLTTMTWAGEVAGTVAATYDNNFKIAALSVNGGPQVEFAYDGDGLLSQAGSLTINRGETNSAVTGTVVGVVTTSLSYTPFGELAAHTASVSGTNLFGATLGRDALGRISNSTETVAGTTTLKAYTYDLTGRLTEVRENGTIAAVYEYDSNGNRLHVTRPTGVETGTYDDQDRLLSYGTASYAYTRNGELSSKTVGSDVTQYDYDVLGNLRRVALSDGTVIDYVVDGMNRRVGKKVNGALVQAWLYQNQLNPIAELDGAGNMVSRFVYGTNPGVPDYMIKNGANYRIVTDHLGSVRLVINTETGATAQRIDYDEWGKVTQNTNPGFQPFGYAGGLYDSPTNLVSLGARIYDASTGRWLTKDPFGLAADGNNLYGYSLDDPVNFVDRDGQFAAPLIVVIPVAAGLVNGAFAALNASKCGQPLLPAFGRGFAGGAAGALAGIAAAEVGVGVAVAGAAAAFTEWGIENVFPGGDLNPVNGAVQTVTGAIAGPLGEIMPGLKIKPGTFKPKLSTPRPISDYGVNSVKTVGKELATAIGLGAGSMAQKCPCK
jgi:RHS repeat-associated protein